MDATTVLLSTLLSLVLSYAIATTLLRNAGQNLIAEVKTSVPEAERLWTALKSESGRARALLKKANTTEPDDDDLAHALRHPFARGILRGAGIDADKLAAGDLEEVKKAQAMAQGQGQNQVHGGYL